MAHRRSSSASNRSAAGPRAGRDGKIEVYCPGCGTAYRLPEDQLEAKIKCKQCTRLFFAKNATKRPSKEKEQKMLWTIGAVVLGAVIVGVVIVNMGKTEPAPVRSMERADAKKQVDLGEGNPRVQDVKKWVVAMGEAKTFDIEMTCDLGKMQERFSIAPGRLLANLRGDELLRVKTEVVDALTKGEDTRLFRELEWSDGRLTDAAMAEGSTGKVEAYMNARDDKKWRSGGTLQLLFAMDGNQVRVTGWDWVQMPEPKAEPKPKSSHKAHEQIGKAEVVTRKIGDVEKQVREAKIVPLEHLEGTPAELRAEIDRLITQLVDLEQVPKEKNKVKKRLYDLGKPAIPRLLTKFYEIPGKTPEERMSLNLVARQLQDMTGQGFGYSPDEISATDDMRLSALRRYYAWWTDNHDRWIGPVSAEPEDEATFGGAKPSRPKIPGEPGKQPPATQQPPDASKPGEKKN